MGIIDTIIPGWSIYMMLDIVSIFSGATISASAALARVDTTQVF